MENLFWKTIHSQYGWDYQEHRFSKKRRIVSNSNRGTSDNPHTWFLIGCEPVLNSTGQWVDMVNCFGTLKSQIDKRVIISPPIEREIYNG